jgi:cell division septation protein DedD
MWFLIKTAFWFSLVLMLLPLFSTQSTMRTQNAPQVQVSDAVTAASGVYQYVSSLCSEKPDVCVKGGATLTALGYQAREGALVAYEMIDHQLGAKSAGKAGEIAVSKREVASNDELTDPEQQPMPAKPPVAANDNNDRVVTGTVGRHVAIPVPTRRPVL